jgi:hypothetical protein
MPWRSFIAHLEYNAANDQRRGCPGGKESEASPWPDWLRVHKHATTGESRWRRRYERTACLVFGNGHSTYDVPSGVVWAGEVVASQALGEASVDYVVDSGDIAASVAYKKHNEVGYLLGRGESSGGCAAYCVLLVVGGFSSERS